MTWSRRSIVPVVLACVAMGAMPAVIESVFRTMTLRNFAVSALSGFLYAACIAIPCWVLIARVQARMSRRSGAAKLAAALGVLAFFAVAGCLTANLILLALGLFPAKNLWPVFRMSLRICLLITFTLGVLTVVIKTLQQHLHTAREQLHQRDLAEAEARFASLESRVRPHFLFNTLNSISALVREDPAEAERVIERLAALLRFSLDSELAGLVTFAQELSIVRDYLEIEKVRFGERIRYDIQADPAAAERKIPALSVQTIVENSVKYAVGGSQEGAHIRISTRVTNQKLRIEIRDDGPGFAPALALKPGHGLDLLSRRLKSLNGALDLDGTPGATLVAMNIAI